MILPIEALLEQMEALAVEEGKLKERKVKLKEKLDIELGIAGKDSYKGMKYSVTRKDGYKRYSVDATKLKKEHPAIYKDTVKVSDVKPTIVVSKNREKKEK